MEDGHVSSVVPNKKSLNSIFTVFSNLTGEKNQNPKYCVDLVKALHGETFDVGSSSNFAYSVKRLVRALGSTRLHAQCGCFAALACLLKRRAFSVEDVLSVLEKERQHVLGATKSEVKALDAGCVLACGAIIHSGLFGEQSPAVQENILKKLIEGGKKKSCLEAVACRFLVDAVQLSEEDHFKERIWPMCKTELFGNLDECNVEIFHLLTVCMIKSPKTLSKFSKKELGSDFSLLEKVADLLFNNSVKCSHPLYGSLAELLCSKPGNLVKIWSRCVESHGKVNFLKDSMLVTFFYHIVKNLKESEIVPSLLVPRFIDVLIKVLTFKKVKTPKVDDCFSTAKAALTSMVNLLKGETVSNETRLETIKKLLLFPANMKFELKTGNKIIQCLVSQLNSDSVAKLLNIYRQIITDELKKITNDEGLEENWNVKEKQLAVISLVKTINHPSIKSDVALKLNQVKFIFDIAFLKKNEFSIDFQKQAKECFYKAVILQMPSLNDLVFLLNELAVYVSDHIEEKNLEISEEAEEWWRKQFSVVQNLRKKLNNKFLIALHVLLIYMGLQLFVDIKLARGGIEELLSCYEHIKSVHLKKKGSEKSDNSDGKAEEPHWSEVTVDLILSLLSRENKLWRHVVSSIFPQVVPHFTPTALGQIIDAFDPASQKVVLEQANSDDSEGETEDDSDSSRTDSDETEDEDEEDEKEEKANDQLRLAVREALGHSADLTDQESVDMDEMDEDEERRLNENLAQAFKLFKVGFGRGKKKRQTKEEEALMHFRLRVLDLVECYIAERPPMRGCLDLVLPLLNLLELTVRDRHQIPLRNRVDSVLRHLSSVKGFSSVEDVDRSAIRQLFAAVIDKREQISALVFVEMSPTISACATFLVRCSQMLAEGGEPALEDEYDSLLKAFFQSRDFKLPISMFQSVAKMAWPGNFKLAGTLFEFLASPSVRIFKKMKIIELLLTFYKNEKLHGSCDESRKSELARIETNFIEAFGDFLSKSGGTESKAAEKMYLAFFSQVMALMNTIGNAARRRGGRGPERGREGSPPWERLIFALDRIALVGANKRTRSQLASLANSFGVKVASGDGGGERKRKSSEAEAGGETEVENGNESEDARAWAKRKKRKKNGAQVTELKRESRKLREEITSNGFQLFKFSSVDFQSLPGAADASVASAERKNGGRRTKKD